jgi:hypothetical protein
MLYLVAPLTIPTDHLREKMGRWLHAPDPSGTHNRLQSECHEGTGEWFFETEEFTVWKGAKPSFLWIRGIRKSPSAQVKMGA